MSNRPQLNLPVTRPVDVYRMASWRHLVGVIGRHSGGWGVESQ